MNRKAKSNDQISDIKSYTKTQRKITTQQEVSLNQFHIYFYPDFILYSLERLTSLKA